MAFIDRIVGPDEDLIGILSVHWIYGAKGLGWMSVFAVGGLLIDRQISDFIAGTPRYGGIVALDLIAYYAFITCVVIGVVTLLFYVVMMFTTELGLTNKRVIYKRGWIAVDVKESDLEEIKAAEVDNGILGRILNYGYINFDARFVENVTLPAVSDPYRFVKAMNEARSDLKSDSMTMVLEGASGEAFADDYEDRLKNTPKLRPERKIEDERYDALEDDPLEAAQHVFEESMLVATDKLEADTKPMPYGSNTGEKAKYKKSGLPTSGPILFKRDIQKRKAALRDKIKRAFKRKSGIKKKKPSAKITKFNNDL